MKNSRAVPPPLLVQFSSSCVRPQNINGNRQSHNALLLLIAEVQTIFNPGFFVVNRFSWCLGVLNILWER